MAHLIWQDNLNTGIDVIDAQHQRIVEYINQLDDARMAGDREAIGEVIESMVDYTLSHFAFEETLMEDAGYEYLRGHRKVHELFTRRVAEFQERFAAGEDVTAGLHGLLFRWLFNHIRSDDAAYVSALKPTMQNMTSEKEAGGWLARSLGRFFGRK